MAMPEVATVASAAEATSESFTKFRIVCLP
jgi:hypothetical protein